MEILDSSLGREPHILGATHNRTFVHFMSAEIPVRRPLTAYEIVGVIIDDVRAHDPSPREDLQPC
jgi:hypothetical protein